MAATTTAVTHNTATIAKTNLRVLTLHMHTGAHKQANVLPQCVAMDYNVVVNTRIANPRDCCLNFFVVPLLNIQASFMSGRLQLCNAPESTSIVVDCGQLSFVSDICMYVFQFQSSGWRKYTKECVLLEYFCYYESFMEIWIIFWVFGFLKVIKLCFWVEYIYINL